MRLFKATLVGKIVKVTDGLLNGKFAMIVKELDKGVGVICDPTEWPQEVPQEYNALYVPNEDYTEITEEAQTMLRMKFPDPKQFE